MKKFKLDRSRSKRFVAIIAAGSMLLSVTSCRKNEKESNIENDNTSSISSEFVEELNVEEIELQKMSIDDLGVELEFEVAKEAIVVTGDINPEKIVKDPTTGKTYVDEAAKERAKDIDIIKIVTSEGEKIINETGNTEDGKYTIDQNKHIIDNTQTGSEIKDSNTGEVILTTDEEIPSNYAKDEELNKIIEKEEVGKYIIAISDYYDIYGNLVIEKGDIIARETNEKISNDIKAGILFTTKPEIIKSSDLEVSTTIQDLEVSTTIQDLEVSATVQDLEVSTTVQEQESLVTVQVPKESDETSEEITDGVINADGTYSIFGLTFESKADYEQWIIQNYEGYSEVNGIMLSDEAIAEYQLQFKK